MSDPRLVRLVEGSTIRYALLRWRPEGAAWYVEELRDELSEIDDLADALQARVPGVELATLGVEGPRQVRRFLKVGRRVPDDLELIIRRPRSAVH